MPKTKPTKLTPAKINAMPIPEDGQSELRDTLVPGLLVRASKGGTKSFSLTTRLGIGGKQVRYTLGRWPALGLADARKMAREYLTETAAGRNPKERVERAAANTFGSLVPQFIDQHVVRRNLRSGANTAQLINHDLLPVWADRLLDSITQGEIREMVYRKAEDAPVQANRLLGQINLFFRWAVHQELVGDNPARNIIRPTTEEASDRHLTDEEISLYWHKAEALGYPWAHFFQFLLVTGQRRSEVAKLPWGEIDLDGRVWNLPVERSKNKRAHTVPLSGPAMAILQACPKGEFVFSITGRQPIQGIAARKRQLMGAMGSDPWTIHGIRHTVGTGLGSDHCRVTEEMIGRVMNHTSRSITGRYVHSPFEAEKREALDRWADKLMGIVDNVRPLRADKSQSTLSGSQRPASA